MRYGLRKRKPPLTQPMILIGVVILVIIAGAWFLRSRRNPSSSTYQNQNDSTGQSASSKGEQAPTATDKSQPGSNTTSSSSEPPKTPYGNFVSNHNPKLNDAESSTCTTSPGAKCKIVFTKGGVTKTLEEKTADSDGAIYWTWTPKQLGLSEGSWQITVTATMNGKTASTTDPKNLVVKP